MTLLDKYMTDMIKSFGTSSEDKTKLVFFNYFDNMSIKNKLFDIIFDITKSIPSSSANGFVTIISLKKDERIKFILKTPKSRGGDDPTLEFKISKEITRVSIKDKDIQNCAVKTWASVKCPANYVNIGRYSEGLGKTACKRDGDEVTHIIMEYITGGTLRDFMYNHNVKDIMVILGITNCFLGTMYKKIKFTHYDLHLNNIMIQEGETKTYNFNLDGNKFQFVSKYHPILIDFGRTYIKPFMSNKKKVDLSKQPVNLYDYEKLDNIANLIMDTFIDPLSDKKTFSSKLSDILDRYLNIEKKNICSYSIKEQTILVATTFILDFFESGRYANVSKKQFADFLISRFYSFKNRVFMDITSTRHNNTTDIIKITMSVLNRYGSVPGVNLLYQDIITNYPFLIPGQWYLPLAITNKGLNSGIFCLDNASDMIKKMVYYKILPPTVIKKSISRNNTRALDVMDVDLPSTRNISLVKKINYSILSPMSGITRDISYMSTD